MMSVALRRVGRVSLAVAISVVLFWGFYIGLENVEVSSTGLNARSNGLMGWDYSYREHTFKVGDGYAEPILVDSGRTIRFGSLFAEILLCLGVGLGASSLLTRCLNSTRTRQVEQDAALKSQGVE